MSGKGSKRRRENTALVEANWPWPDKGSKDGMCSVHGSQDAPSQEAGAEQVQAPIPHASTEARG